MLEIDDRVIPVAMICLWKEPSEVLMYNVQDLLDQGLKDYEIL